MHRFILTLCTVTWVTILAAQPELEKSIQTQLILAEDDAVIQLPAGIIRLSNTLSLDGKKRVTIRGAGQEKTILTFKNQTQGAEGMRVTNAQNIVLEDFTIEDAKGDLIKAQMVNRTHISEMSRRAGRANQNRPTAPMPSIRYNAKTCASSAALPLALPMQVFM